jgi:hypothetical protein
MSHDLAGREFQFWQFTVSHESLLVRSPMGDGAASNVDLMFVGVEYVELPRLLDSLQIDTPTADEVRHVGQRLGRTVQATEVTVLVSNGRRYVVVAVALRVAESDMDIFDSPFGFNQFGHACPKCGGGE